jgi:hypothetical protein
MKIWDRLLATVTAASLVVGGIWTVWAYFKHQKEELDRKRQEYLLTLRKEKRELYQPLCTAAARIATAQTMCDAEVDIATFWQLYWGQVHFVSDVGFQEAKERFRDELMECLERSDEPPSGELRKLSHELAMAVQNAIKLELAYGVEGQTGGGANGR